MLKVKDVSFAYDKEPVLEDISFVLKKGQHLAVMGESGCGKSTLLKIIYGVLQTQEGAVYWGNKKVRGPLYKLLPGERFMKYLSQEFDLMPYTTVEENLSEFLSVFHPEELKERTRELLYMTQLEAFAGEKVQNLSGGQQQRVALGRVLAQKPELILLDEPFSHIDNFRKNSLRRNLYDYLKKNGVTCITATHDQNDVLPFADRIIVLKDRQVIADEAVMDLYDTPGNIYIATLFGEANRVPIHIMKSYADTRRMIIVYAHEFKVSHSSGLKVVVSKSYPMGHYCLIRGDSDGHPIFFHHQKPLEPGTEVFLNIALETINKRLKGQKPELDG
jgi:ABC-type Fe3+/spermidine/putrescine transport system ATPase subunit